MKEKAMYDYLKKSAQVVALATMVTAPAPLLAGNPTAPERDRTVMRVPGIPTVLCARLGQEVPLTLAARMDCDAAKPRVAGERVRNRSVSIFERFQAS